jgi:hypothetical protein
MKRICNRLLLLVFGLALAVSSVAQVTTSGISGQISDPKESIIGATVQAIHQPSGTMYGAITNDKGRYAIQGMRVGGPYKIIVSYVGYNKVEYNNVYLELGNTFILNAQLQESSQALNEVTVTASGANRLRTGAGQNFSTETIQNMPTVNRNVYDIVKNMPMAQTNKIGGISFSGTNNRYNSFQIDGTVSNDVFGLSATGTNGGQTGANPISLDAIQEIQVVVAPFDVRQSGFTGGGINAVTKQGTNELHGDAYSYYFNQNLYGSYSAPNNYAYQKLIQQHATTLGASLGGPIIKDKVFFFFNVESFDQSYPSTYYPGYSSLGMTAATATKILNQYESITGLSDSYNQRNVGQTSLGILARIDWNIDKDNKFAFRYQHNNSSEDIYSNSSSSFTFDNSGYTMKDNTNSFVTELNSHISNALYNELRGSLTTVRDSREVPYQGPTVYIASDASNNNATVSLGTDYSSGANKMNSNTYTIEDNISWYKGAHTFTFGTHNEIFHFENLFVQYNNGEWYYSSLTNFLANQASTFYYKYTDPQGFIPKFNAGQFGFYAQDKWDAMKDLILTYGLRIDIPDVFDHPATNSTFNSYAQANNLNASVGTVPSTKVMLSPRVGFRWYLNQDHSTLLRGGTGLFTGRVPFVWLSNVFTNDGVEQKGTTINSTTTNGVTTWAPSFATYYNNPNAAAASGAQVKPDICTVSKNFKFPQVFRSNLALEQKLPGEIKLTLEGMFSKTLNDAYFRNLALTQTGKIYAVAGNEASAAPYYSIASSNYNSIIDLENTNKGYTYALSAMLEKKFDFGLNTSLSYTFGHSKSVFDGTSSVAYSNWKYNYAYDSNNPALGYSSFDIPNRIVASIGYTTPKYANGLFNTDISLTYTGSNGMRYSLTMNEKADYNGDGYKGNSLLYIPTVAELQQMNFVASGSMTADQSRANFENWIEGNQYAKNHRGEYSTRNCCQAPWEDHFDLHLAENVFFVKNDGLKLQLTADIINFGNLLDKKWGVNYLSTYNVTPLAVKTAASGSAASFYYNTSNTNNNVAMDDISSRWHAQVGIKLIF